MAHIQFILFGRLVNKSGKTLWKILNSLAYFSYLIKQVRQVMGCANSRFEVAMGFNNLGVATIEFKIGVQVLLCEREKRLR